MEIILVRHTTPNIEKGICYGQSDIGVTNTFNNELQEILKQLPNNISEYTCYASPLHRCKVLAEKISDTIIFDERLKELNFGDWELKNWTDINKEQLDKWMTNFVEEPTKNGESYIELHQRTTEFLKEIKLQQKQKVIIFTHAGVIRSLHSFITQTPLSDSFNLKLQYGEILHLNY